MGSRFLVLVAALALAGCSDIPGTSANKVKVAKKAASDLLIDPSSAQFRSVQAVTNGVCGEINGKNRMGAYVGFTRFVFDSTDVVILDPQFEEGDLARADDLCSSMRSNEYSSASNTESMCKDAEEERAKQSLQGMFDERWSANCSTIAVGTS